MYALVVFGMLLLGDLMGPQAAAWYSQLLADGGYGRLPRERAAFLIRESDGTLTLQPWDGGGFRHASFRGRVPERTLAVLHTHPRGEERPSQHDRDEARRLRMPVIVITPGAVVAAMPDGSDLTLERRRPAG
ncbi:MAG TPA: Mov34/MPN/PAD-1 family protein [Thermoanaerobaculia bacterium]|nr:Mov34/MPN/PAD-1 family protein [Thermoanaerobaculia bacterium]